MIQRKQVSELLRSKLLKEAGYQCSKCKATPEYTKIPLTEEEKKALLEEVKVSQFQGDLSTIPIYHYIKPCWNCKADIELLTYCFPEIQVSFNLGDNDKLDLLMLETYAPNIQKRFSKSMEKEAVMNICQKCSRHHGNIYLLDDLTCILNQDPLSESKLAMKERIPHNLTLEELGVVIPSTRAVFNGIKLHVHHRDKNPANNSLGNLQVLCEKCHAKQHPEIGFFSQSAKVR